MSQFFQTHCCRQFERYHFIVAFLTFHTTKTVIKVTRTTGAGTSMG